MLGILWVAQWPCLKWMFLWDHSCSVGAHGLVVNIRSVCSNSEAYLWELDQFLDVRHCFFYFFLDSMSDTVKGSGFKAVSSCTSDLFIASQLQVRSVHGLCNGPVSISSPVSTCCVSAVKGTAGGRGFFSVQSAVLCLFLLLLHVDQ